MEMMEITLPIRKSSLEAFKKACSDRETLQKMTDQLGAAVSDAAEIIAGGDPHSELEQIADVSYEVNPPGTTSFVLRTTALQMLNSYACLLGSTPEECAMQLSEVLSEQLELVLKERIADKLGLHTQPVPASTVRKKFAPPPPVHTFQDTTGISDGLGDEEPEEPEGEKDPTALVPTYGGLTEEVLEKDMKVEDPEHEAKADAPPAVPGEVAEETFASLFQFDNSDPEYVDDRIRKRKKGPSKSRGKALNLTDSVLADGAGV